MVWFCQEVDRAVRCDSYDRNIAFKIFLTKGLMNLLRVSLIGLICAFVLPELYFRLLHKSSWCESWFVFFFCVPFSCLIFWEPSFVQARLSRFLGCCHGQLIRHRSRRCVWACAARTQRCRARAQRREAGLHHLWFLFNLFDRFFFRSFFQVKICADIRLNHRVLCRVIVQDVLADPKWENIAEQIKGMDISVLVNNVGGGTPGFVFRSNWISCLIFSRWTFGKLSHLPCGVSHKDSWFQLWKCCCLDAFGSPVHDSPRIRTNHHVLESGVPS